MTDTLQTPPVETRYTPRERGINHHSRTVRLGSHDEDDATVTVRLAKKHAALMFSGFWHDASIAMTHEELAAVRDAITATLAEGWSE